MRLYGLDVIRIISFWEISCYHFIYVIWRDHLSEYDVQIPKDFLIYNVLGPFFHAMSFSGHTIVLLSTFLIAFRNINRKIHWRLFAYIILAWVLFSWADQYFRHIVLYWEVYPLLVLGLLIMEVLHRF